MTTRSPARGSRLRTALICGLYHCTVTVSAQGTAAVTAQFTEQWTG